MQNQNVSILHLISDEKFLMSVIWQFEKVWPKQNIFKLIVSDDKSKLKNNLKPYNVELLNTSGINLKKFTKSLSDYDLVVIHGLNNFKSKVILRAGNKIKILWMFFGAEIYNNPKAGFLSVIGKDTNKAFKPNLNKSIRKFFYPLYHIIRYGSYDTYTTILKAAKKIRYVGILHQEDFDNLLANNILSKNAEHIVFTYYPIEFLFRETMDLKIDKDNILLGNSAYKTNNHIEAFDILSTLSIEKRKIITPLSYGYDDYAKLIIQKGKEKFGNNFIPITTFLPLEEYNLLLKQCGIVIMNNYRQQSVGNIIAMLWLGAKVYLDERNTFYSYLVRNKIKVFSIKSDLVYENKNVFTLLNSDEIQSNRKILIRILGKKTALKKLKTQVDTILNNS